MRHMSSFWLRVSMGVGVAGLVACGTSGGDGSPAGGNGGMTSAAGTPTSGGAGAPSVAGSGGAPSSGAGGVVAVSGAGGSGAGAAGSGTAGAGVAGGAGAPAKGIFVSPQGSDDNAGSVDAPLKTLAKARDLVRSTRASENEDAHVYLRGGRYELTSAVSFGPEDSGQGDHRVYYEAYPGENPGLTGSVRVTGWSAASGGIYKASLNRTTKLRNLYVNDARASMTSKTATARGGYGTYSVTAGQADWAWASGSGSDGVKYNTADIPSIAANKDDLEIVNGTTWNENIVCVRDVVATSDGFTALQLQQPYGAIAQLPGWNSGFSSSGTHTILNAFELLKAPGQFYFDKSAGTLYYYPKQGEDMATAEVEAPIAERLIDIAGTATNQRVRNLTFRGLTFQDTDYNLLAVGMSHGKATVQGATVFVAYGDGNWHNSKYEILDTLPAIINLKNADGIDLIGNVIKHAGSEGVALVNDVQNSRLVANYITDIAGSGVTVGHPQHVYIGDKGTHARYAPGVEGICKGNTIDNNVLSNISSLPGFGGHAGVTAFFVDSLHITHNHVETTAYNGINLGWGWKNFTDSTTCKDNEVSKNRLFNTLSRLHDSGAIYTIGQMPGTHIDENYVKGIPAATSGPTYGLHNDEGSAFITENDNVLDISPGVTYTINCEDYGDKHDLTILRTFATVNKMGVNPPNSKIDPPVAVPNNSWPLAQYERCVASGVEDAQRAMIPGLPKGYLAGADYLFPASASVAGGAKLSVRKAESGTTLWLAPHGTTQFMEGPTMSKAAGDAGSIAAPTTAASYRLFVVDSQNKVLGEATAEVTVK